MLKRIACIAILLFCGMLFGFFSNLHTTTADASTGGAAWTMQIFHNLLHGRALQSSLYASLGAGSSVGFSHNPHAYIHTFVIHMNLTPYLLAPVWALRPTLAWLYALIFLLNYAGWAYFAWRVLQRLSPASAAPKALLAAALLLSSGFFFPLQQKAQPLLFSGPLIIAAYDALLRRRTGWFLTAMGLLCLTSEDAAIFAGTFALYLAVFEPTYRRHALAAGAMALGYLAAVLLIVQPAARAELTLMARTNMAFVLGTLPALTTQTLQGLAIQLLPVWGFLPVFGIAALLFGRPTISVRRVLGLLLIAPLAHWGEIVLVSAGHHLMPVMSCLFLAFVLTLASSPGTPAAPHDWPPRRRLALAAWLAVFWLCTARAVATNLPVTVRPALYRLAGKPESAQLLEERLRDIPGNRRVLEVIRAIPANRSLVFWINSSLESFIAARSDLWKFPDYYDVADTLVIQRDARHTFFAFPPPGGRSFDAALADGRVHPLDQAVISEPMVRAVIKELVEHRRTHRLAVSEASVVILERLQHLPIPNPPSTRGLGWWHHLPGVAATQPQSS